MKKLLSVLLALAMILTFTACGEDPDPPELPSDFSTVLTVWGMTCVKCVNKITEVVSEIDGVIDVFVDLEAEKVTVLHEEGINVALIEDAITREGFNIP